MQEEINKEDDDIDVCIIVKCMLDSGSLSGAIIEHEKNTKLR